MRDAITRREQHEIAAAILKVPHKLTITAISIRFNITIPLAESIICRFELPFHETTERPPLMGRIAEEGAKHRMQHLTAAAKINLAKQISAAKADAPRSRPYKKGPLQW